MKKKNRAVMMMTGICLMAACLTAALFLGCDDLISGGETLDDGPITLPWTSGFFTLAGAGAHNGKYAVVIVTLVEEGNSRDLYGATALRKDGSIVAAGVQISGGTVTLPMYEPTENGFQAYTRTEAVLVFVYLVDSASYNWSAPPPSGTTFGVILSSVSFTNGIGAEDVANGIVMPL
jgi:hypothetical protein